MKSKNIKKQVDVAALIEHVNEMNKLPDTEIVNRNFRQGRNSFLEIILHETKCYAGFGYYQSSDLPQGVSPGIIFGEHDHVYPDDSRRFYYLPIPRKEA